MPYRNLEDAAKASAVRMRRYRAARKAAGNPVPSGTRIGWTEARKSQRQYKSACKFSKLHFLAWDGEGVEHPRNRYIMLSNSDRHVLEGHDLSQNPEEIFEFLLAEGGRDKYTINVIFSGLYDFTHWIYSLPDEAKVQLYENGVTFWGKYCIKLTPRKSFSVTRIEKDGKNCSITIYDVFGFFQCRFISAIIDWLKNELTPEQLLFIDEMKMSRARFSEKNRARILEYNFLECELLARLMTKVRDVLQADPENSGNIAPWIRLDRWDGAGALAEAIYRKEGMKHHVGSSVQFGLRKRKVIEYDNWHYTDREQQQRVEWVLRSSYFGGRIECLKKGRSHCKGWDADIKSAYPHVMLSLPSFAKGGRWKEVRKFNRNVFGVWHLTWKCGGKDHSIYPFPYRTDFGEVIFPKDGEGWYHTVEVNAAMSDKRNQINIISGWVWEPATNDKPFSFVQSYFDQRARLKCRNHPAEKVLKLGLNSLYGKTAQTTGSEFEKIEPLPDTPERLMEYGDGEMFVKTSAYFNLSWAGAITAGCRARLYTEAIKREADIVMIQTDGLFGLGEPPKYVEDGTLGSWEVTTYKDAIICQAGVYWLADDNGWEKVVSKTRGFNKADVTYQDVLEAWSKNQEYIKYKSEPRFITMGACILTKKNTFGKLAKWLGGVRELDIYTDSKRYVFPFDKPKPRLDLRMYPAHCLPKQQELISRPYNPKWREHNDEVVWMENTIPREEGSDFINNGEEDALRLALAGAQEELAALRNL